MLTATQEGRLLVIGMLLIAALCLATCSNNSTITTQHLAPVNLETTGSSSSDQDGLVTQLPSPRRLVLSELTESAAEIGNFRAGADYVLDWPKNRVEAVDGTALFSPDWRLHYNPYTRTHDPPRFRDLAFCIYRFELAEYEGTLELNHSWVDEPNWSTVWIGLADLEQDSWQWLAGQPAGLELDSLEPYLSPAGELAVAIVVTGSKPARLGWLRFGGNLPPIADLNMTHQGNSAPLPIGCDASASYDLDGEIVVYEYDFDSDGTWDTSGENLRHAGWIYDEPGSYEVALRVTDDTGAQTQVTTQLNVTEQNPPGWHLFEVTRTPGRLPYVPSLAAVGGSPAIGFVTESDPTRSLNYLRSLNSLGANWPPPVAVLPGTESATLRELGGLPTISASIQQENRFGIKFVQGTDLAGTEWEQTLKWRAINATGTQAWDSLSGVPFIAYWQNHFVWFRSATDDSLSFWQPAVPVLLSHSRQVEFVHSFLSAGNPAVIVGSRHWADILFCRALNAAGTEWSQPVEIGNGYSPRFSMIGNSPAIAYFRWDNTFSSTLLFRRGIDAAGSDWSEATEIAATGRLPWNDSTLFEQDGNPAIFFYRQHSGYSSLYYTRSNDLTGTDWIEPLEIDTGYLVGENCSAASIGGRPAVAYNAQYTGGLSTQQLMLAIYY